MRNEEMLKANKAAVVRFNREVIERGDEAAFAELVAPDFVNRTAPPGSPAGPEGMIFTFAHFGQRDHADRSNVIAPIGAT